MLAHHMTHDPVQLHNYGPKGPGLAGDYFEMPTEAALIHKLNTLRKSTLSRNNTTTANRDDGSNNSDNSIDFKHIPSLLGPLEGGDSRSASPTPSEDDPNAFFFRDPVEQRGNSDHRSTTARDPIDIAAFQGGNEQQQQLKTTQSKSKRQRAPWEGREIILEPDPTKKLPYIVESPKKTNHFQIVEKKSPTSIMNHHESSPVKTIEQTAILQTSVISARVTTTTTEQTASASPPQSPSAENPKNLKAHEESDERNGNENSFYDVFEKIHLAKAKIERATSSDSSDLTSTTTSMSTIVSSRGGRSREGRQLVTPVRPVFTKSDSDLNHFISRIDEQLHETDNEKEDEQSVVEEEGEEEEEEAHRSETKIRHRQSNNSGQEQQQETNDDDDDDDDFVEELVLTKLGAASIAPSSPPPSNLCQSLELARTGSFSSSIHEEESEDDDSEFDESTSAKIKERRIRQRPIHSGPFQHTTQNIHNANNQYEKKKERYRQKLLDDIHQHEELFMKLSNEDDFDDFIKINKISFAGDMLLGKMLHERSRIEMKREMLHEAKDMYIKVHSGDEKTVTSTDRSVYFMI